MTNEEIQALIELVRNETNIGGNTKTRIADILDAIKTNMIQDLQIVTYLELTTLITNNSLIKGNTYLLSDYMTTYTQPVTLASKSSGIIEPLYLTALNVNKLSNIAYSQLYPEDIIYYEVTGYVGENLDTEGFTKGKIYRRIDTQRNNDIGTDWRHVKYDRNGVDKLLFEDYTICNNNIIKTYFLFNNVIGGNCYSNTINNLFIDNTIGNDFFKNQIGDTFIQNNILDNFSSNIITNNFQRNTILNSFISNTIKDNFTDNTLGIYFALNTIDINFTSNSIGDYFYSNSIGAYFSDNLIAGDFAENNITNYFSNNNILNNFKLNTINNFFQLNTIGAYFNSNIVGNYFVSNVFSDKRIDNNTFENYINGKFLSFYNPSISMQDSNTSVTIFRLPNSVVKERYYDNTSTLIINTL